MAANTILKPGLRTVRMWSSWEGKCVRVLTGHKGVVCTLKVSPCGRVAASAGDDKKIRIWDLNESKLVKVSKERGYIRY